MIENLFGGGGGGGGTVDTITAGTGISVDSTDPANPIVTNTSLNTDETAKVSSNDTTAGYLNGKLVAGTGVTLTENNNGSNETLTIATTVVNTDETAKVSSNDTTAGYLNGKLVAGTGISFTENNNGSNETLSIVNSAPGDTTYAMTLTDVENTSVQTDLVSFTVPGNTWANGEIITLDIWYHLNNTSGIQRNLTSYVFIAGTQADSVVASVAGSNIRYGIARFKFWRDGSVIRIYNDTRSGGTERYWANSELARPSFNASLSANPYDLQDYTSVTPSSFASNIVLKIAAQWGSANAAMYLRTLNARAYKLAGQQT